MTATLTAPRPSLVPPFRSSASPTALPNRLDSLTSLRFFAAFAVFAHHFSGHGKGTGYGTAPALFPYSMIGGHGVTFFFVLSGFLLTWVFKPQEHPLAFYWRRMARIWPASLVAAVLGVYAYYIAAHEHIDWPSLLASLFLVQTWFPGVTPTLPGNEVTWTLSVELLFYALFPLAARIAVRYRTRTLALATAAGLVGMWAVNWWAAANFSGPGEGWIMRNPLVYLPQFLLGMTVALAVRRGWRLPMRPIVPVLLLGVFVYGYYQGRASLPDAVVAQLDYTVRPVMALLSMLIIVAFVQREINGHRGVLNQPVLILLGAWSYGFYLLHHSVSRLATYAWGRAGDDNSVLFDLLGVGLVVTAMSWALFHYVEEPAAQWLNRKLPQRLRRRWNASPDVPPSVEVAGARVPSAR
ncbi:acyltransferase family protein [Streptomyces candidus]|uniref:Peptidoglycan/LPS O-acetylase OafA/YrhL n=1 Tax=Streptomyces candidus TaxID=67283 RepID=A0A7X0HIR3_9ACTN|nr:acyltransferase [Streptomyces candidus]MBB6436913.1 peptidoglycan/LPS O-acetylase OafA/YrhL [Streptomyces candidus]GHH32224.1 acyltransferase [Streptomyces candidus]